MKKKILITGGTGFIGRHLVKKLSDQGHSIRVFSLDAHRFPGSSLVEYISGDFLSLEDTSAALKNVEVVYHLAATTTPGNSNERIIYDAQTNLIGSLRLIQTAAEVEVERFIFISSGGAVYGPTESSSVNEDHPTNPLSAHGVSKLAIEKYLEIYRLQYGMDYRIARGGNPYGEWQDPERGQGFIPYVLGKIAKREEIVIWGDGSVVRDFFYVGDFVEALTCMLDDHQPQYIYNVGSGQGKSLIDILTLVEQVTGQRAHPSFKRSRPADVPYNCLDITRITNSLGWNPKVDLNNGIQLTWDWVNAFLLKNINSELILSDA